MLNYISASLIVSIILSSFVLFRTLSGFIKNFKRKVFEQSKLFFILFLTFIISFMIFKLIISFLSPSLDVSYISKFEGTTGYMLMLFLGSFASLFMTLAFLSLTLCGLSLRGLKKYEYYGAIFMILLWLVNLVILQPKSIFYEPTKGWVYTTESLSNYTYNLPFILITAYFFINIIFLYNKTKNDKIRQHFKNFIYGLIFLISSSLFSYVVVQKIFLNYFGLDILGIAVSSFFFYKTFK